MKNEATNAGAMVTAYSAPSNVFPQPRYAVIDLGTNETPVAFNNPGSVVLYSYPTYTYWTNGALLGPIGLSSVAGMNNNGVVIGTETNSVEYQNTNISLYLDHAPPPLATWTAANGLGAALPDPTSDYIADAPLSPNEGITAQWQGNIGGTPVGIGDDNATVYGNYSEGYGDDITDISAGFGAELNTLSRIGDIIISTNTYQSPITYPPGPVLISTVATPGTLDTFTTQNGANVALGYQETVDGSGDYSSPTWVAYDGASFHTLAHQPRYIASNNDIVGNDTGYTNVYLWPGTNDYASPVTLPNGISGPINCQDEIVSGSSFWQSNQVSNLYELISPTNGWTSVSAAGFNGAINDSGAIVGTAISDGSNTNYPSGSHGVMFLPAELAVDADRNGTIVLANENPAGMDTNGNPVDVTTQAKPFRFWVNNDQDNGPATSDSPYASEVVPQTPGTPYISGPAVASPDCNSDTMVSVRDLEDWTRLWFYTKGFNSAIVAGTIKVGLKWKNVNGTTPGIKIVQATDSDGGTAYLTDSSFVAALAQATTDGTTPRPVIQDDNDSHTNIVPTGNAADFVFPTSGWVDLTESAPKTYFLFEGTSRGKGQLEIVFLKSDGTTLLGEGGSLWLDLRDIKEMYEREMTIPVPAKPYNYSSSPPTVTIKPVPDLSNPNGNSGVFVPDPTEDTTDPTYIVFVHGYNMTFLGATNYAETMFKRLWWRGYKGRFAAFRWNTYGDGTAPGGTLSSYLPGGAVGTYNDSEFVAWHSGAALYAYVSQLKSLHSGYSMNIVSHSMGAMVAGEAIEEGMSVDNYAILHGAASASCYSTSGYIFPTTNYGGFSPDTSSDPATSSLAYRYAFQYIGGSLPINFFDDQDSVVGIKWELNNNLFKPQRIYGPVSGTLYYYDPLYSSGNKLGFEYKVTSFRGLTDFGEARAYADYSLTGTIGGTDTMATGAISNSVNDNAFGDHHSNEFNWPIQKLKLFYGYLMANFDLTPNP